MNNKLEQFFRRLDKGVDQVRQQSQEFCQAMKLTGFAYVRVYDDGRVGWVTTDSDHDRLLVDAGFMEEDPLIDTAKALKEGYHLWFHDREFPGARAFYNDRKTHFKIDHGMTIVNHHQQEGYLESFCFDGCLSEKPLYNIFMNEMGLFQAYAEYFKQQLSPSLLKLIEDGILISDIKTKPGEISNEVKITPSDRKAIINAYGWDHLLSLSPRERQCLELIRKGHTYHEIGVELSLSSRTVEHYIESIKNKLGLENRAELCYAADKLTQLGLCE